jgi:ribosomal protein S27AE
MDPYDELRRNFEMISPVKKCPKCGHLSLEFDPRENRIVCTRCGFEKLIPKMK